jgi:hypothetical protein
MPATASLGSVDLPVRYVFVHDTVPPFPLHPSDSFVGLDTERATDGSIVFLSLCFERDPRTVFLLFRPSKKVTDAVHTELASCILYASNIKSDLHALGWPYDKAHTRDLDADDRVFRLPRNKALSLDTMMETWLPVVRTHANRSLSQSKHWDGDIGEEHKRHAALDAWMSLLVALAMTRPCALPLTIRVSLEEDEKRLLVPVWSVAPATSVVTRHRRPQEETTASATSVPVAAAIDLKEINTNANTNMNTASQNQEKKMGQETPIMPLQKQDAVADQMQMKVYLSQARTRAGFPTRLDIARRAARILFNSVPNADRFSLLEWETFLASSTDWIL